ncbi:MAG: CDP-diacylglycerol--glycerol-3-phosphate 3-phosphatidyltransferase [Chthoniobacteraceae bacterium]
MNLPNQLTVGRFFLTLLFVAALSSSWAWAYTAGLVLFGLASLTDYADGEIARRYNLVTDFGKLMDPLVDKIMMAAAFICLVPLGAFPPWVAIIIISREFLITGLRMLAASKGVLLPAENLGKHKTIWQIITVLYFLLLLAVGEVERSGFWDVHAWWPLAWTWGGTALIALATGLTLYSGLGYLWRNRHLIEGA